MSAARRVLCLVPHLNAGGAERVMVNVANHLAKTGTRVTVATIRSGGVLRPALGEAVTVVDLGTKRASASVNAVARLLRSEQYESLFVMKSFLIPLVLCARLWAGSRVRVVFREVVLKSAAERHRGWSVVNSRSVLSWAYNRLPVIIVPAVDMRDDLVNTYGVDPRKVKVIPNPVDIERIETLKEAEPRHPWFLDEGPSVVLAMGRLEKQKGFDILIRAVADVDERLGLRVAILGEGTERASLQGLIDDLGLSKRVELLGLQDNPYSYLSRAAVFVLSSRFEGFPNALLEAMACGVPSVSSDCPSGPSEIIEDSISGLLVPVEDPSALARAIERVVRDRQLANDLGRRGRVRAGDFATSRIIQQFRELLLPGGESTVDDVAARENA